MDKVKTLIFLLSASVAWGQTAITQTLYGLNNGGDHMRFSLEGTAQDLYPYPYNQVIQEYTEMDELRAELDKFIDVHGMQKIQMVLGHCSKPYYAYLKTLEEYLFNKPLLMAGKPSRHCKSPIYYVGNWSEFVTAYWQQLRSHFALA